MKSAQEATFNKLKQKKKRIRRIRGLEWRKWIHHKAYSAG
jgi:hypothetical protein